MPMLVVMSIQVISRYTLGLAVPWTDEVSRYLFLAEIFLGSVLALRYHEHIRITIVTRPTARQDGASCRGPRRPDRHRGAAHASWGGAWNMMGRTAGVFASTFPMSFSYLYLMQFIAALLMLILLVGQCQRHLRGKPVTPPATTGATEHGSLRHHVRGTDRPADVGAASGLRDDRLIGLGARLSPAASTPFRSR